jgi:Zn-dependent protease with chaperone function
MNESRYVPKPDVEGINVADADHPLKDLAILLSGFLVVIFCCYWTLISLSDWALAKMTLQQEMYWFNKLLYNETPAQSLPDAVATEINQLIEPIKLLVPFPLQISLLCSDEINALALPGGRILLTKGLLDKLQSKNALMFVLGHEAGHIVHRDHLRGMGRKIILSVSAALLGFADAGALSSLNQTLGRVYDRDQEMAADAYALQLTQTIYGHTWGADELFALLSDEESLVDRTLSRLAGTHPPSIDRLHRIQQSQLGKAPILQSLQLKNAVGEACLASTRSVTGLVDP